MPFWQLLLSWFLPIIENEVATVLPIATTAVNNLAADELTAVTSGDAKDTGHILAKAVQNTADQMAAAGVAAGAPAILTAVAHAVAAVAQQMPAPVPSLQVAAPPAPAAAAPADDGTGHPGLIRSP